MNANTHQRYLPAMTHSHHPLEDQANNPDIDPTETQEWRDAFNGIIEQYGPIEGPSRAKQLLDGLVALARQKRIGWQPELTTPYVNTIDVSEQTVFPGDLAIEEKLGSLIRWNALAMVARANAAYGELGGHLQATRVLPIYLKLATITFLKHGM
jgi:pyruvate dehydrogenase E1 component